MVHNPDRDAVALLLAELDKQGSRGPAILEPYAGDWLETGRLVRSLINTALYLGVDYAETTPGAVRDELQLLAEGLALD